MNLKDLEAFKLNKVQMKNLVGGANAICRLKSADGTVTPVEVRTNIQKEEKLCAYMAETNEGYEVLGCTFQ